MLTINNLTNDQKKAICLAAKMDLDDIDTDDQALKIDYSPAEKHLLLWIERNFDQSNEETRVKSRPADATSGHQYIGYVFTKQTVTLPHDWPESAMVELQARWLHPFGGNGASLINAGYLDVSIWPFEFLVISQELIDQMNDEYCHGEPIEKIPQCRISGHRVSNWSSPTRNGERTPICDLEDAVMTYIEPVKGVGDILPQGARRDMGALMRCSASHIAHYLHRFRCQNEYGQHKLMTQVTVDRILPEVHVVMDGKTVGDLFTTVLSAVGEKGSLTKCLLPDYTVCSSPYISNFGYDAQGRYAGRGDLPITETMRTGSAEYLSVLRIVAECLAKVAAEFAP